MLPQDKVALPQVTLRASVAGLAIGTLVLVLNFQFGLQTGWVLMMLLPLLLLGYAVFRGLQDHLGFPFSDVENVYVQSVAVATGTGPLAYGFVGIIPAMEKMLTSAEAGLAEGVQLRLGWWQLVVWSVGLGFFGVFFAVVLREQVVVREKLPFPSGSATATLIGVLHQTELREENGADEGVELGSEPEPPSLYSSSLGILQKTFALSGGYTIVSYFLPALRALPVFGSYLSKHYLWNLQPSPAYVGQGIIMGLPTTLYMMFGAVLGWAVLAPWAQHMGWAPGKIDDWKEGAQGWILWVLLAVMVADSVVSFAVVTVRSVARLYRERAAGDYERIGEEREEPEDSVPPAHLVPLSLTLSGILLSCLLCVVSVRWVFGAIVPVYTLVIAILLALVFSVMGVRALGETDLNPVSGIGKLSQLVFGLVVPRGTPGAVLINLVAGGIAEAGAQQAGDLMQDLKTGHLVGASPRAQFVAQLIGSGWLVAVLAAMYRLYDYVYTIPGDLFRVPTAVIWVDCLRLVTGGDLPPHSRAAALVFGVVFAAISLAKNLTPATHKYHKYLVYLPSGVAVGVGMYNQPSFTLARFVGGVVAHVWSQQPGVSRTAMVVFSSGLVLGEGVVSIATMAMTSVGVPHW